MGKLGNGDNGVEGGQRDLRDCTMKESIPPILCTKLAHRPVKRRRIVPREAPVAPSVTNENGCGEDQADHEDQKCGGHSTIVAETEGDDESEESGDFRVEAEPDTRFACELEGLCDHTNTEADLNTKNDGHRDDAM
mmetsp:Transcript_11754/g.18677  ORF Transcript_11754/g.18677 Transcript_11754/m.18677 type:complete len:136 (+) Transcript_11754:758-1165(+)